MSEVNAVCDLLQVEEPGVGNGSRCAGPRCAMVRQFQHRGTGQGAPHQHTKEVAARSVPAAGNNMIARVGALKWMLVMMRMRVIV